MRRSSVTDTLAVVKNSLRIVPEHFEVDLPRSRAVQLFKEFVELIEIETTAYCNRTCSFCPNSFLDRRTIRFMPDDTWQAILAGMREVDYDGTVVWSRYSEPTSEKGITERIKQVKEAAPNCRVCINTNGDYLNAGYLEQLADAGVSRLWIDTYVDDMKEYTREIAEKANGKLLKRLKLEGELVESNPEYAYHIIHPRIEITNHVRNVVTMIANDLSDRGGLISIARKAIRNSPCYAVFKHLVVDWDGSVMPCCQVRSDSPKHKDVVLGRIGDGGLDLVTAYLQLATWREPLSSYGEKLGVCSTCNVSDYQTSLVNITASKLLTANNAPVKALRKFAGSIINKKQRY